MAHEPKKFLKQVAAAWKEEFPFLKPVDLNEVPRMPKGTNFLCEACGDTRELYYFIAIEFSPKLRGQFTVRVAISDSPNRSTLGSAMGLSPSPTTKGSFGVQRFLGQQQFSWALVDLEKERDELLAEIGMPIPELGNNRTHNIWRPSSYEQPFESIAQEAIEHLNSVLRTKVFPVLKIELS